MKMTTSGRIVIIAASILAIHPAMAAPDAPDAPIPIHDYKAPIRVACVGDSITAGAGTANAGFQSYPAQLTRMLDEHWAVSNFGVSGATLLNSGNKPYQKEPALQNALKLEPDVVVIMLGGNDTKPDNWKFKDRFSADYKELIEKFKTLPSHPRIFICHPTPVPGAGNFGINEAGVEEEIPVIDTLAKEESVGLIDMHASLVGRENLLPDRVHPNVDGATILAKTVFKTLTGKEFQGEVPAIVRSEWSGCQRLDFLVSDRSCTLVIPKTPAAGNPWIWRTEFFGAFPSADQALLAKGYHVAYMNVSDMYGAPVAIHLMDQFYDYLTKTYQLSHKTIPEGFSRGGLYAFNWSAANPEKVASVYVDAPVCDLKSWPGGKYRATATAADWERCKKVYGLTEEEALAYPHNPIDNLKPLADAKIPIIAVCGDADTEVPLDENINIVEKRYKELGGEIQVIRKPGVGHHPHSLANPKPIVDFIVAHQQQ